MTRDQWRMLRILEESNAKVRLERPDYLRTSSTAQTIAFLLDVIRELCGGRIRYPDDLDERVRRIVQ